MADRKRDHSFFCSSFILGVQDDEDDFCVNYECGKNAVKCSHAHARYRNLKWFQWNAKTVLRVKGTCTHERESQQHKMLWNEVLFLSCVRSLRHFHLYFLIRVDIAIALHLNAIKLKPKWMYDVFKKSFSLILEVFSFKFKLGFKSYQKTLVKTTLLPWTHSMWFVFRLLWTREIFILVSKHLRAKQILLFCRDKNMENISELPSTHFVLSVFVLCVLINPLQ